MQVDIGGLRLGTWRTGWKEHEHEMDAVVNFRSRPFSFFHYPNGTPNITRPRPLPKCRGAFGSVELWNCWGRQHASKGGLRQAAATWVSAGIGFMVLDLGV